MWAWQFLPVLTQGFKILLWLVCFPWSESPALLYLHSCLGGKSECPWKVAPLHSLWKCNVSVVCRVHQQRSFQHNDLNKASRFDFFPKCEKGTNNVLKNIHFCPHFQRKEGTNLKKNIFVVFSSILIFYFFFQYYHIYCCKIWASIVQCVLAFLDRSFSDMGSTRAMAPIITSTKIADWINVFDYFQPIWTTWHRPQKYFTDISIMILMHIILVIFTPLIIINIQTKARRGSDLTGNPRGVADCFTRWPTGK